MRNTCALRSAARLHIAVVAPPLVVVTPHVPLPGGPPVVVVNRPTLVSTAFGALFIFRRFQEFHKEL